MHDAFVGALVGWVRENARPGLPEDDDALFGPLNNACQLARVAGLPRRPPRATRPSPSAAAGPTGCPSPASSTRRRSSPASGRTTGSSRRRSSARSITVQSFRPRRRPSRWPTACPTAWRRRCGPPTSAGRLRLSADLDFGCVWVNAHIPLVAEMPHGGFKMSGHGKDLSAYSRRGVHPGQARDVGDGRDDPGRRDGQRPRRDDDAPAICLRGLRKDVRRRDGGRRDRPRHRRTASSSRCSARPAPARPRCCG